MQWVRDNFLLLFAAGVVLAVVWNLLFVAWYFVRRAMRVPRFPPRSDVYVLFDERWASGRSLKAWYTRYGGAINCLRVTVTDREIWVVPHYPFRIYAVRADLEHRIRFDEVLSVQRQNKRVRVEFRTDEGDLRALELWLRRSEEFLSACDAGRSQEGATAK